MSCSFMLCSQSCLQFYHLPSKVEVSTVTWILIHNPTLCPYIPTSDLLSFVLWSDRLQRCGTLLHATSQSPAKWEVTSSFKIRLWPPFKKFGTFFGACLWSVGYSSTTTTLFWIYELDYEDSEHRSYYRKVRCLGRMCFFLSLIILNYVQSLQWGRQV